MCVDIICLYRLQGILPKCILKGLNDLEEIIYSADGYKGCIMKITGKLALNFSAKCTVVNGV